VGADGEDASRTARALNGIGLEGLRRLLSTGRLQIRTVGEDDDEEEEDVSMTKAACGANDSDLIPLSTGFYSLLWWGQQTWTNEDV
jgi:predicted phage tail protein